MKHFALAWTPNHSAAALAEGWDIFETERDDRTTLQIQAWNDFEGVCFGSDARALGHVIDAASTGNALHQMALAYCCASDPLSFAQDLLALINRRSLTDD
jgi:hypothetical protein